MHRTKSPGLRIGRRSATRPARGTRRFSSSESSGARRPWPKATSQNGPGVAPRNWPTTPIRLSFPKPKAIGDGPAGRRAARRRPPFICPATPGCRCRARSSRASRRATLSRCWSCPTVSSRRARSSQPSLPAAWLRAWPPPPRVPSRGGGTIVPDGRPLHTASAAGPLAAPSDIRPGAPTLAPTRPPSGSVAPDLVDLFARRERTFVTRVSRSSAWPSFLLLALAGPCIRQRKFRNVAGEALRRGRRIVLRRHQLSLQRPDPREQGCRRFCD